MKDFHICVETDQVVALFQADLVSKHPLGYGFQKIFC